MRAEFRCARHRVPAFAIMQDEHALRFHISSEGHMANIELERRDRHGRPWLVLVLAALALLILWLFGNNEEVPLDIPGPAVSSAPRAAA